MARRLQRTEKRCDRGRTAAALLLALLASVCGAAADDEPPACGNAPEQVRLQLRFTGLRSTAGQLTITVYPDEAQRFLAKRGQIMKRRVPVAGATTAVCLVMPAAGHYAITAYHDENGDGRFNRTLIGLPEEGYGFSNDAPAIIGPPAFEDARFAAAAGDNALDIRIRY